MGKAVISSNVSLKVNRAISGATTVNANCYAVVTYQVTSSTPTTGQHHTTDGVVERYFGPAQSIPATFTGYWAVDSDDGNQTYTLLSGVEFINSP